MRKGVVAVERRVGVVSVHDGLLGLVERGSGVHDVDDSCRCWRLFGWLGKSR